MASLKGGGIHRKNSLKISPILKTNLHVFLGYIWCSNSEKYISDTKMYCKIYKFTGKTYNFYHLKPKSIQFQQHRKNLWITGDDFLMEKNIFKKSWKNMGFEGGEYSQKNFSDPTFEGGRYSQRRGYSQWMPLILSSSDLRKNF